MLDPRVRALFAKALAAGSSKAERGTPSRAVALAQGEFEESESDPKEGDHPTPDPDRQ